MHITQEDYETEGKKVIYEYFIDILTSSAPEKIRKCLEVEVKPIIPLNIILSINPILSEILSRLK